MTKRTRLIWSMLLVCIAMIAFLEASRRSWEIHSRLSVVAQGHVFYRVVHTTEMAGRIPEHYPIHTLESQRLVYSGHKYLGYLSKHGFFVPDGQNWDSAAAQDFQLTVVSFWLELLLGVTAVAAGILVVLKIGQPDGAANGSQPSHSETNRPSSAAGSRR
jgi:hypothetical protein